MHSKDYARRLLKRLDLSRNAGQMLDRSTYWDETVCKLYCARCDGEIFDRPLVALTMAKIAPRLALLIPEVAGQAGRLRHRSLIARAYGVLGSAYRAVGDLEAAQREYQIALRIINSEGLQGVELGTIYCRMSVLATCKRQFSEALELIDRALTIYADLDDTRRIAEGVAIKSAALGNAGRYSEAIDCCGECLDLMPNPNTWPRTYYAATHNMALWCTYGKPDDLNRARSYARRARRLNTTRRSVAVAKFKWIEARIMIRLGSTRRGEAYLLAAISRLDELGAALETALAALELSELWRRWGEWQKLRKLAARTYARFRELSADSEAIAALGLWLNASRTESLTAEIIQESQRIIEARMAPGSCVGKQQTGISTKR